MFSFAEMWGLRQEAPIRASISRNIRRASGSSYRSLSLHTAVDPDRLPDSKTGTKVVQLGQPAVEILLKIERVEGNPWLIERAKPWRTPRINSDDQAIAGPKTDDELTSFSAGVDPLDSISV
jgi:hypothetical protein